MIALRLRLRRRMTIQILLGMMLQILLFVWTDLIKQSWDDPR
jgi:hypothetical protein